MSETRQVFPTHMTTEHTDATAIGFDDGFHEGWNLRKQAFGWEIFIRERGVESDSLGFPYEFDALYYLCEQSKPPNRPLLA